MSLQRILFFLELLPGLIIGLTVHEAAHALSAKWLGDRNAERMGRISLNPFKHLSPLGTAALFFIGFGWAKPVMVNIYNFKRPKLYYFLSSIAGPISNLLLCAISLGILYLLPDRHVANDGSGLKGVIAHGNIYQQINYFFGIVPIVTRFLCGSIFFINAILAVVNLIPIPPLDGSKIWPCVIPKMKPTVSGKWSNIWLIVLLVVMFSGTLDKILGPIIGFLAGLLPK
jgi:Zn-dependent protease